jgi:hypothetical protein
MTNAISQPRYRRDLRFEPLESRRMLSITVDTLIDENNGVGIGAGTSLREAMMAAVSGDTIDFSVSGTIKITSAALPVINKNLTIQGPGANLLTIDANDPTPATKNGDGGRVFTISDGNYQHLLDVSISGLTLTGGDTSTFSGGGGAINSYENLVVSDCVITGNGSAYGNNYGGGAIQSIPDGAQYGAQFVLPSSLTVRNSILSGNTTLTGEGGAIRKRFGTLLVEDCVITGNSAYWDGGGVSASDSVTVQINRSIISNNRTTYSNNTSYGNGGGAFVLNGTMTITASTISGNTAQNGGGVHSTTLGASLVLVSSTISGNSASAGGGVYAYFAQITNSTLSGNTATSRAGAIQAVSLTMTNSTVTANTSPVGTPGAVKTNAPGGNSKISSSIIAGNTNGDVSLLGTTSLGYNLIGTGSGASGFNKTGDQTGVANPMLGPLADNGGPTKTHTPLLGSPALDTGNPTFNPADPDGNPSTNDAMPSDQRGTPLTRVYDGDGTGGARIDKGAVERQPVPSTVMGDYDQNGVADAGDYLVWRKSNGATGLTPYTGADGNGDGVVDQADYSLWRFHFGSTLPTSGAGSGASSEGSSAAFEALTLESTPNDDLDSQPPALPGVPSEPTSADVPFTVWPSIEIEKRPYVLPSAEAGIAGQARDDALVAWAESRSSVRAIDVVEFASMAGSGRGRSGEHCDALDVAVGELLTAPV